MNKSRVKTLEKKIRDKNRKHREIKTAYLQDGVYTTRDGMPLTKDKDGSLLLEDGTLYYDATEPNPYNEVGLIVTEFVSVKDENTKEKTNDT